MATVPLRVRGKILGFLWVSMLKPKQVFSNYDMMLFESIGGQAAVAIDNINLFEEQKYISETLQRGFLPKQLPELKHTDTGIFYASATEAAVVGGDIYDALQLPNGQVSIFVGDVSGQGVEATTDAAMVKYTLRAVSFQNSGPSYVLTKANNIIANQLVSGRFITLVYGSYYPADGKLLLGMAGHPYPLLYSAAGNQVTPVVGKDPALTLIPSYEYTEAEFRLSSGDILILYTDGIIELRRGKEFFGIERLSDLLAKYSGLKAQDITNKIMDDAREFSEGHLADDIVLMVIKRTD